MEHEQILEKVKEIENIISEINNEDETIDSLQKAMEYFCGTWDKCEGYKHAIRLTLEDQSNNHIEDLAKEDLDELKKLLTN
jgi:hypothetical protein